MVRFPKSIEVGPSQSPHEGKSLTSAYIGQARERYALSNSDLEIDEDAEVSVAENGAWVAAWVWVPKEQC
jgi:hypothetical protein